MMKLARLVAGIFLSASVAVVAAPKVAPVVPFSAEGEKLAAAYSSALDALRAEIAKGLPVVDARKTAALDQARAAVKKAEADAEAAKKLSDALGTAVALVGHAKGKWIGGAEKGIAQAQAALKKATTDAERAAAQKDLAHWEANKADGIKALNERQAALDKLKVDEPKIVQANQSAQAALGVARTNELKIVGFLLAEVGPLLAGDKLDAKLVKAAVLAHATPRGLAVFAQQGAAQQALVTKLLGDDALMKEMLVAGGAAGGNYGRAMEILSAIRQAGPKSRDGVLQRLALATALEHAVPVPQSNAEDAKDAATVVDPVKRYQHYEKAFLDGELDPAFKDFTTWELRMVVDCDAPDAILAWGREMLRTYRPDQVLSPDYGWRYSGSVRTDVTYGSQNVKNDLPSLHDYQNIPMNGGVCGRRAFYGRFILKSFGIPTWGVTQHKHAALSHWTPKGWVINLGAGFHASWWDKDDAPRSGSDFLLESQAREHGNDYLKVLRAQWISRVLGEQAFNDRKKVAGGFWSNVARDQALALAAHAVTQGPLGAELAEANESKDKNFITQAAAGTPAAEAVSVRDGAITIPATLHTKPSGSKAVMKGFGGGSQMHCGGGFKARYVFDAPQAGNYSLTARVATLQGGQKFLFAANESNQRAEVAVPHTVGLWQPTAPVVVALAKGPNVLDFEIQRDSRGVTIQSFTLAPVR